VPDCKHLAKEINNDQFRIRRNSRAIFRMVMRSPSSNHGWVYRQRRGRPSDRANEIGRSLYRTGDDVVPHLLGHSLDATHQRGANQPIDLFVLCRPCAYARRFHQKSSRPWSRRRPCCLLLSGDVCRRCGVARWRHSPRHHWRQQGRFFLATLAIPKRNQAACLPACSLWNLAAE
jgi:hypothetical protein